MRALSEVEITVTRFQRRDIKLRQQLPVKTSKRLVQNYQPTIAKDYPTNLKST